MTSTATGGRRTLPDFKTVVSLHAVRLRTAFVSAAPLVCCNYTQEAMLCLETFLSTVVRLLRRR